MDFSNADVFINVFLNLDVFLLIVVRIMSFIIILPVLAGQNIPNSAKIALSIAMAYLVFISGRVTDVYYNDSIFGLGLLILQEFLVGFTIGFVIYLLFNVFFFVGQLIDYQIGFSMVSVLDPLSQIQVPVTGNLLYLFICIIFVESGGLNAFIAAFFYSYNIIPIGLGNIIGNEQMLLEILYILGEFLVLGVKASLPVMGSILVLDAALGLLVKAVPQMNIFVVGMPIKLFVGLIILVLVLPIFSTIYDYVFDESYRNIINIMRGMAP